MQVKVKITGLDCPNCARSLQSEINKLDGIQNAQIDFVKSSLIFDAENKTDALNRIIKLTKQLEPDAKIDAGGNAKPSAKKQFIIDLVLLLVGISIGVFIFFCPLNVWVYWSLYIFACLLLGYKTYIKAVRLLFKGVINENLLITISVVGASIISEHMEGLMVIALYSIGKLFESLAVNKSRKSIESLVRMQPEYANLIVRGKEQKVVPAEVKVGSKIVVNAGEKVPIDGEIISGQSLVDNQSLTGESVPVLARVGDKILSGGIVLDGTLIIKTTAHYKDSAISKIMNLVENANENKSKTETFISRLTRWYTLGVVVLAVLVWGIVWAVTKDLSDAFYRGLIFLVVSCPCAFAISVPLSYFSGLGNASKNGVLIKGSNYLDACSNLKLVAFDKTGTLTSGNFEVKKVDAAKGYTKKDVLYLAALGEQHSLHPLAKAIVAANKKRLQDVENIKEFAGKGVQFKFENDSYFVGRQSANLKSTVVELTKNSEIIGTIELADSIKPSAKLTIDALTKLGVKSALLSGDNLESVNSVAQKLNISDVHANLLPDDKYNYLKSTKNNKTCVGYVGDGINDAPSLAMADVGFSMGINGAPASIEASDVVIVDDNPQKIVTAIKISRYTRKIVWENIILSAIIKITFLTLGALGITGMLAAVFADMGVTLLAVLNSLRALKYNPNKHKKEQK